jgi:hypothetical protein
MSATWLARDIANCRGIRRQPANADRRKSILRRIRAAFLPASQREAHRLMARLLRQSGGRLTDDIERALSEQLTRNGNLRV